VASVPRGRILGAFSFSDAGTDLAPAAFDGRTMRRSFERRTREDHLSRSENFFRNFSSLGEITSWQYACSELRS